MSKRIIIQNTNNTRIHEATPKYTIIEQCSQHYTLSEQLQSIMPRTATTSATPVLLQFNCGYARCAVKDITTQLAAGTTGKAARVGSNQQRAEQFCNLFSYPSFGIPVGFFTATSQRKPALFEVRCGAVLDSFKARWKSQCKREEYLMTFTTKRWRKLTAAEKAAHSLQNCMACAVQHADLQHAFPGPTFTPTLQSMYESATTSRKDERAMTRQALQYVNVSHQVHS